ncbi:BGTF surface domain-containing protein [Haloarcula rubripromontorii]|uniref:PGF-CTERM sorting domain-containing protein n=1 Tax=Haloarcula rubripromontorii TaxID=1705562 RepID=A0A847U2D6_9EURY|nr:BGTF surface domain-containing protein [Haloarcula rubripromontorii]NLV07485.1 PGF-CTERM sorting domain-containing protein [Haloarcula rubripromontorii]
MWTDRTTTESRTGATEKLRSVLLSALLLMSVVAGTVAVSGTAAAASNVSVEQAVEYSDASGASTVELALSRSVTNGLDGTGELEVYLDGDDVSGTLVDSIEADGTGGRVAIDLTEDVTPDRNLTVTLTDFGSDAVTATDIDVTSQTITPASSSDSDVNVYHGEVIAIEDIDADPDSDLLVEADGGSVVLDGSYADNSQVYVLDTDDLDAGQRYDITAGSDTAGFRLSDLDLTIEADTNITDEDSVTADVTSVRGGTAATATLSASDGDEVATAVEILDGTESVEFDFGSQSADDGPYTVSVTDNQTGVTVTSDDISVSEAQEGEVRFENSVVSDERGDVVSVTYRFENTDDGYVVIGDESEENYAVSGQITDDDGDGEVTVLFNSYLAGVPNSGNASISASDVLSVSGDDEISGVSESGSFARDDLTAEALEAASYEMNATAGTSRSDDPDTTGTLRLETRSTERVQSWVAPKDADLTDEDIGIHDRVGANLTQSSEVADGDIVVHRITATGIEGALDYRSDVEGAGDTTAAFLQATGDGDAFNIWVNRTNVGANADEDPLRLNDSNVVVVDDPDNDTYFVAVELANANYQSGTPIRGDDDEVTTTFVVSDATGLTDEDDSGTANYTITERDAGLDATDGLVTVEAAANQSVSGTTTIAPGSEVEVSLDSESEANPFIRRPAATVASNGTFTATADMSEYAAGVNFTADVLDVDSDSFAVDGDGRIVTAAVENDAAESSNASASSSEATTEEPTDRPTEAPTPTESSDGAVAAPTEAQTATGSTDTGTTAASGPGFTAAVALVALVAAALLAVRHDT